MWEILRDWFRRKFLGFRSYEEFIGTTRAHVVRNVETDQVRIGIDRSRDLDSELLELHFDPVLVDKMENGTLYGHSSMTFDKYLGWMGIPGLCTFYTWRLAWDFRGAENALWYLQGGTLDIDIVI